MAGLGFKTFVSGEVLTAADTNGYLMQGVLVFANASSRTAAITVPTEGMFSYLKDTNSTEYYDGSAWVSGVEGDISAVTAGTGITGGGTSGAVTVSFDQANFGGGQYAAGKNILVNGDYYWNQRAFTSTTTAGTYGFDRWSLAGATDGTTTMTAQTFGATDAPLDSYEQGNYVQVQTTGQTLSTAVSTISNRTENVKTFAGQTVTVSFYAKAASGTPKIAVSLDQYFGATGSAQVNNYIGSATLTTSWARYSLTGTLPNVDSKTFAALNTTSLNATFWLSAGSTFNARTGSLGIQTNTFSMFGVQVEAGSTATPFQTATGTKQGELAACQRYFYAHASGTTQPICIMTNYSAVLGIGYLQFPVTMRATPSVTAVSGASYYAMDIAGGTQSFSAPTLGAGSTTGARIDGVLTAAVVGQAGYLRTNNAAASLAFASEL